jgi:hypothetical protein
MALLDKLSEALDLSGDPSLAITVIDAIPRKNKEVSVNISLAERGVMFPPIVSLEMCQRHWQFPFSGSAANHSTSDEHIRCGCRGHVADGRPHGTQVHASQVGKAWTHQFAGTNGTRAVIVSTRSMYLCSLQYSFSCIYP